MCAQNKREGTEMHPATALTLPVVEAVEEPTVTISAREYSALKATAELLQHMDVYKFTLQARDAKGKVPLEEAFGE